MDKREKQSYLYEKWNSLPLGQVRKTRAQIISECYITMAIFNFWLKGRTEIPTIAMPILERIFNELKEKHE